jgi:hypothetical protein
MSTLGGPNIVTSGLVLHLDALNTKSYASGSTVWYDLSNSGNNGTLSGSVLPTYSNGAIANNGLNSYITIKNAPSFQMGTGDFTISSWVKIISPQANNNPGANWKIIINCKQAPAANAGYGFDWNPDYNKFLWSTGNNSVGSEILCTNAHSEILNNWAHIVMVRQSGSVNNGCFYINNVYEPLASSATVINVTTTNNMIFGNTADFYYAYWSTATYANVQIYNRALSSKEVQQNFNAQRGRFGL